jgi:branched-chain amino acid transport system permease protein
MVIYGTVLVLIVMFMPRGVAGSGVSIKRLFGRGGRGNG